MAKDYVSGTFAADGNSSSVLIKERGLAFIGGAGGTTFGGGSVQVQAKGPDGQWYDIAETVTAADVKGIELQLPAEVRLKLSGATGPDLDYAIQSDVESYRD